MKIREVTGKVKTDYNTLAFPLGPLVAVTSAFQGDSERDLSKNIAIFLERTYISYRDENINYKDVSIIGKEFLDSSNRALEFISSKIKDKVKLYSGSNSLNQWHITQLIELARIGLIFEKTASGTSGFIRDQIEAFMDSKNSISREKEIKIKFNYKLSRSSENFYITITQNDLVDFQIEAWGKKSILDSKEYTRFRADAQIQSNDDVISYLRSIIKITGGLSETVKIFPLYDTKDANLGYQFLEPEENTRIGILPSSGYFDIDLKVSSDMVKLHHIVNLLLTGKFAMVMKHADGTLTDGKMICAFDWDRFLQPQDIYSVGGSTSLEITNIAEFANHKVVINGYSTVFQPKEVDSQDWRRAWSYPRAWSADLRTQNSDLLSYLHYLQDNTQDSAYINSFIRYYMERINLRIENFYTDLRAILR